MPEDVKPVEMTTANPVVTPEPVIEDVKPHPLAPGGERFAEVYRDMQQARRDQARLEGEIAELRRQQQVQPKQPQTYTREDLDQMVKDGKISVAVMADQLAWQRSNEMREQVRREERLENTQRAALNEVNDYIDRLPALNNTSSQEFAKVKRAAEGIADEMGLDMRDPRVQRRALREAFGTLDRVKAAIKAEDRSRSNDGSADTGGGGGAAQTAAATDSLKGVPKAYVEHWQRLGYTAEQMKEEAKFVRREPRKVEPRR